MIDTNLALGLGQLIGRRDYPAAAGPDDHARGLRGLHRHLAVLRSAPVPERLLGERRALELRRRALRGSSYLKLPKLLQFFSGNIGVHYVHHLSARIPNYNLQRAHDENPIFHHVPTLSPSAAVA